MILSVNNISFRYQQGNKDTHLPLILDGISCQFESGNMYALMGRSGSGKSTFLSLLGKMDTPIEGSILYDGEDICHISPIEYLRKYCTTVYQDCALFPLLTVEENISFPMELQKINKNECRKRVVDLLKKVELPETVLKRIPGKLSGGEQQRVAIARALAVGAKILLADEPTGNLDRVTTDKIIDLLFRLAHEEGYCVIAASHDMEIVNKVDMVFRMEAGKLIQG